MHGIAGTAALCLKLPFAPILRTELAVRVQRAYHGWSFDRKFGVETAGWIKRPMPEVSGAIAHMGRPYDGTIPHHFRRIIRGLNIRYQDFSFVDLGSGKGRVLLMAAAFPFRSITGVEWSKELHETAERNIAAYTGPRVCRDIGSLCGDAGAYPIVSGNAVLYFFNPFKDQIMARVMENVRCALQAEQRELFLIYVNPQSRALLQQIEFLKPVADHGWFVVYRAKS